MNANPQKTFKSRLGAVLKATEEFDAPAPPRPPPDPVPYSFARDQPHNPFGFQWSELIPDLAVLDGHIPRSASIQGLRLVSRLELGLIRRTSRTFLRTHPLPVVQGTHTVIRVDNRRRFASVGAPDNSDYAYITTAPYPTWAAEESQRNRVLAELTLVECGI